MIGCSRLISLLLAIMSGGRGWECTPFLAMVAVVSMSYPGVFFENLSCRRGEASLWQGKFPGVGRKKSSAVCPGWWAGDFSSTGDL